MICYRHTATNAAVKLFATNEFPVNAVTEIAVNGNNNLFGWEQHQFKPMSVIGLDGMVTQNTFFSKNPQ